MRLFSVSEFTEEPVVDDVLANLPCETTPLTLMGVAVSAIPTKQNGLVPSSVFFQTTSTRFLTNPNLLYRFPRNTSLLLPLFSNGFNIFLNIVSFTRSYIPIQTSIMTDTTTFLANIIFRKASLNTTVSTTPTTVPYEEYQRIPTQKDQFTDTFFYTRENTSETVGPL